MKEVPKKHCGNCGEEILCKVNNIEYYSCSTIELSPQTRKFLLNTHFDCLCNHCLEAVNRKIVEATNFSFPTKKEGFIEDVHFYREGNRWVFTELYHILKGNCCGNGCRHCVYGFTKQRRKHS